MIEVVFPFSIYITPLGDFFLWQLRRSIQGNFKFCWSIEETKSTKSRSKMPTQFCILHWLHANFPSWGMENAQWMHIWSRKVPRKIVQRKGRSFLFQTLNRNLHHQSNQIHQNNQNRFLLHLLNLPQLQLPLKLLLKQSLLQPQIHHQRKPRKEKWFRRKLKK